jgi:AraC-like DNA-binding protein
VTRLLDLMADPEEAALLGPLVIDEILIRLLRTSVGPLAAGNRRTEAEGRRVRCAVALSRHRFAQPITVEEMAASVHMSASTFHVHFKAVTSMSPLQYQKVLRLHEARRLMLFQRLDATRASQRVGYVSGWTASIEQGA